MTPARDGEAVDAAPSPRWSVTWTAGTMRTVVYSLVAVQIVQGWRSEALTALFVRSYWAANYRYGFVRRGLGGEVLRQLVGTPSRFAADAAEWVVAAVAIVAVLALVEALIRTMSPAGWAMALVLAASPFTFDYLAFQRRPDVLGIAALVLFGFGVIRTSGRALVGVAAGAGVAFAVLVFAHEGIALMTVPWAFVLLVVLARRAPDEPDPCFWPAAACLLVPPAVTFSIVAAAGTATASMVAHLHADVSWIPPHVTTVLDFLVFDAGKTADIANYLPWRLRTTALVAGGVLVLVQATCVWAWARASLLRRAATSRPLLAGIGSILGLAVGTVLVFRSGTDWLRWFAAIGCGWLVTTGVVVLAGMRRTPGRASTATVAVPVVLIVVAVVLVLLQPLPDGIDPDHLRVLVWR